MISQDNVLLPSNNWHTIKWLVFLLITTLAFNQAYAQFEIKKYTINSGGSTITGGSFVMNSSVGQVDASHQLSGDSFMLNGGFWHENTDLIFKNNFENL